MPDKKFNSVSTPNHSITPNLSYYRTKTRVDFNGSCLKQDKITFNHGKTVNIYIVSEISLTLTLAIIQLWKIVYLEQLV